MIRRRSLTTSSVSQRPPRCSSCSARRIESPIGKRRTMSPTLTSSRESDRLPVGDMVRLSVLDLAPITQGSDAATTFRQSLDYARHAERLGMHRYWLAEHHNLPGIGSAATAILIAHVASGTTTIRVGAGGIMLPNHAPLMIAEQF